MSDTKSGQASQTESDEQTIRLARKQFARRQWARRWLAWRGLLIGALVLGVVGGSVWLVFFSKVLAVSAVTIEGLDVLPRQEVRTVASVPIGDPLATVDLDAITARVEGLAPVKEVDVSRAWPDQVRIVVVERVAVAAVDRDGVFRGLDEDGVLFREYDGKPKDLPVVRMSARTRAEALAEAAEVVGALPAELARKVDFVEVETVDTISLRMRNGRTIFWGSADDSVDKAKVIEVLIKQKGSVYDVSVPAQPTIKK